MKVSLATGLLAALSGLASAAPTDTASALSHRRAVQDSQILSRAVPDANFDNQLQGGSPQQVPGGKKDKKNPALIAQLFRGLLGPPV